MTTELTKALEACPFCGADPQDARHIEYGRWAVTCRCGASGASANTGPNATDAAKIKAYNDARTAWNTRALTQRPAAQTEREAFEAWALAAHGKFALSDSDAGSMWSAWQAGRASLPAPQQATPATPEDMKVYDGIAAGYFADTQQATPEPVGEPVAYREKLTGRLCEPEDTHRRKFPMCYEPLFTHPAPGVPEGETWGWAIEDKHGVAQAIRPARKEFFGCVQSSEPFTAEDVSKMDCEWAGLAPHRIVTLFTRPAPGVPEGWRNVIAGTLKTDPWDSARVADYNSGWNDCQRKTLRGLERLAAAQAKGAGHA